MKNVIRRPLDVIRGWFTRLVYRPDAIRTKRSPRLLATTNDCRDLDRAQRLAVAAQREPLLDNARTARDRGERNRRTRRAIGDADHRVVAAQRIETFEIDIDHRLHQRDTAAAV